MFKIEVVGKPEEKIEKFFKILCNDEKLKKLGYEMYTLKENGKIVFVCMGKSTAVSIGLKLVKKTLIKAIADQLKKIGCDAEIKEVKV